MPSFSVTGLNHMGLVVEDMNLARKWFVDALGLEVIEDRGEIIFLLAGNDVIAIKTPAMAVAKPEHGLESDEMTKGRSGFQTLDHYGFYASTPEEVDQFAETITAHGAEILKGPYDRRDGRSVYVKDPLGNVCEYLYFEKK